MENYLLGVIIVLLVASFFGFIALSRKIKALSEKNLDEKSFLLLNQNVQGMQSRLDKVSDGLNTRLDNAAKVIGEVNKELGQVQEMGRQMKDLQDFLRSPKLRGNIGEQVLRDLLSQYFPQHYFELQHKFKTGQIVDAIIKTDQGFLSIDAKFPLENFQKMAKSDSEAESKLFLREFIKDVRKHIRDISRKYILPEEGTIDFAVMYVPSEAIYYEIIRSEDDLHVYAQESKVLIVSPNSFFYFLKVIMMGLQGRKIEEATKRLLSTFQAMSKDSEKMGEDLSVLHSHISNASSAMERVNTGYVKLTNKIDQIKLLK
ncbi:MAG: DNA recombination protein RmuC [Patescibacteria group bacterium]